MSRRTRKVAPLEEIASENQAPDLPAAAVPAKRATAARSTRVATTIPEDEPEPDCKPAEEEKQEHMQPTPMRRTAPLPQASPALQNAVPATPARSSRPLASPIPATPARKQPIAAAIPSTPAVLATPRVTPVAAIPSTPATGMLRAVPCTPAAAAAVPAAPITLPPRPTMLLATNPSLLRAMDTLFSRIDQIARGVPATHGPPLDVVSLYASMALVQGGAEMGELYRQLAAYLAQEHRFPTAAQLYTTARQSYKMMKALPHMEAEMELEVCRCIARQALEAALDPSAPEPLLPARTAYSKLFLSCAPPAGCADKVILFSLTRTTLRAHHDLAHWHMHRALLQMRAGMPCADNITQARSDWAAFLTHFSTALQQTWTADQRTDLSKLAQRLVDDLWHLLSVCALLTRADGTDYFARLAVELLSNEVRSLADMCHDVHLQRWRIARLLQSPPALISEEQRQSLCSELTALPIGHTYTAHSAKNPSCATQPRLGVLTSLYELAFVSPMLQLSPAQHAALHASLHAVMSSLRNYAHSTDEEIRLGWGLFYLALGVLATKDDQNPLQTSFKHSEKAIIQFRSMAKHMARDGAASSAATSASSSSSSATAPLSSGVVWSSMLDLLRAFNFRAVLSEAQGLHGEAQSLLQHAMNTANDVILKSIQDPSAVDGSAAAAPAAPYACMLAGKMARARIHARLDRMDLVAELLMETSMLDASEKQVEQAVAASVPFMGAFGVHAGQVIDLQRKARDNSSSDDLSNAMQSMRLASSSEVCAQCKLHPSAAQALVPCHVDALMASLSPPHPLLPAAKLHELLVEHASWSYPPLTRLLHHQLAQRRMEEGNADAAMWHVHQSLALTARHQVNELLSAETASRSGDSVPSPAASVVPPAASAPFTLRTPDADLAFFREHFLRRIPDSWTVCTADVDARGALLLSKTQRCCDATALTHAGQRMRVLLESCLLADVTPAAVQAAVESILASRSTPSSTTASSLVWRIDGDAGVSFAAADALFVQAQIQAAHGHTLAKEHNIRLAAHASGEKTMSVKERDAGLAGIDQARHNADESIKSACAHLQQLLGAQVAALCGRWEEADVEQGIFAAALALQKLLAKGTPASIARALNEHVTALRSTFGESTPLVSRSRLPVVLLLGGPTSHLPWESMPALLAQNTTRMASWSFMLAAMHQAELTSSPSSSPLSLLPPVSLPNSYFVLNPQQNIAKVESVLFSLVSGKPGWTGSVGAPNVDHWVRALRAKAYFTYVGHNGGEEFVSAKVVRGMLKPSAAAAAQSDAASSSTAASVPPIAPLGVGSVALQLGCSSALQHVAKGGPRAALLGYDPDGLSMAYQIARCPAMFGCLWPVTGAVDAWITYVLEHIDAPATTTEGVETIAAPAPPADSKRKGAKKTSSKQSDDSSSKIIAKSPPASLQHLAMAARATCKYPHLNAAAIICYGLPIAC